MRKLTLTLLLVIVVAIFGLGLALDALFERYNTAPENEYSQLQSFASGLSHTLNRVEDPQRVIANWPEDSHYTVALEEKDQLPLPEQLKAPFETGEALLLESENGISLHYLIPHHQKVLSIKTAAANHNDSHQLRLVFTGLFYLGTLLLVLLWLKPLLHRLTLLRQTTRTFGAGNLNSRVDASSFSYIRDIETDFNNMADRIQQLVDDNKLLTSAVSHDLRTPLARLRFGIDTLAESDNPQSKSLYLSRINNDLKEMENLVNSLLKYARLDNVLSETQRQPVPLRSLINECVSQYYDSRIMIRVDESRLDNDEQLQVHGGIDHLATVFNNLIQNAIDHARNRLIVELSTPGDSIVIAFCDDGPGIPEDMTGQLLKPFQRGENSGKKNYGLGLAVVARIAKHHNAVLKLARCKNLGGAKISLTFPSGNTVR